MDFTWATAPVLYRVGIQLICPSNVSHFDISRLRAAGRAACRQTANRPTTEESCSILATQDNLFWGTLYTCSSTSTTRWIGWRAWGRDSGRLRPRVLPAAAAASAPSRSASCSRCLQSLGEERNVHYRDGKKDKPLVEWSSILAAKASSRNLL